MKSLTKEEKLLLRLFQCDFNRSIDESFAQVLSENDDLRLFFINENEAFTDGRNIVVDPSVDDLFVDKKALFNTEEFLKIDHAFTNDSWNALRMITRAQNIHESLHIIYSTFPNQVNSDKKCNSKARLKVMALISNIIEDSFIEAAGCSVYDNLEFFIKFERISRLFANAPSEGTVNKAFENIDSFSGEKIYFLPIIEYLNYMATFLFYPMIEQSQANDDIAAYIEETKGLFLEGSIAGNPDVRYSYTGRIFDIIEPLIPENDDYIDDTGIRKRLGCLKTHSSKISTIGKIIKTGKAAKVFRRLFADLDGKSNEEKNYNIQIAEILKGYENEKQAAIKIVMYQGRHVNLIGKQYDCAKIHNGIKIEEIKPKINLNLKKAYQNIYNRYSLNINSYNLKFIDLLKAKMPVREDRFQFGSGIASKRMGDINKRYWFRNVMGVDVPDIAIMLLIDGSGSMDGPRRECAMISSIILHEVLKKQGIKHSIVEHRAIYGEPLLKHNILVDYNASDEEKYNILSLQANEGTREGLTLYWAEKYINANAGSETKLLIVLSDGVPSHGLEGDGCYFPPVSIKDTANAVAKISKRGLKIVAVALDDTLEGDNLVEENNSCYTDLKQIYPNVVVCNNLKHLTGKLLSLVSKQLG